MVVFICSVAGSRAPGMRISSISVSTIPARLRFRVRSTTYIYILRYLQAVPREELILSRAEEAAVNITLGNVVLPVHNQTGHACQVRSVTNRKGQDNK